MKRLIILIFFTSSFAFGQTESLTFDGHSFLYNLADTWGAPRKSHNQGFLDAIFKRAFIFDSKKTRIIPNLLIKLVKLNLKNERDTLVEIEMFTITSIMNFAPPEVIADYKNSINIASEYGLNIENSFGFNSPYTDGSGTRHTCLYFTIFDKSRLGVFICVDATEEVFLKIKREIQLFLSSIKLK